MGDVTAGHYFAGVIGTALLRSWYADGDINDRRLVELRSVLDHLDEFPNSLRLNPEERGLVDGYAEWAAKYDGPNPLITTEELTVLPLLDDLARPGMRALDAACGTGRHAAHLLDRGCTVSGVDQSPAMLEVARGTVPGATFETGTLESLPYNDSSFELITVSLALCHLADPSPAIDELARVLAPGGSIVISDPHPATGQIGGQAFYGGISADRPMTWVRNHHHSASSWLAMFRDSGLTVDVCLEPEFTDEQIAAGPAYAIFADAVEALGAHLPTLWVWVVRQPDIITQ